MVCSKAKKLFKVRLLYKSWMRRIVNRDCEASNKARIRIKLKTPTGSWNHATIMLPWLLNETITGELLCENIRDWCEYISHPWRGRPRPKLAKRSYSHHHDPHRHATLQYGVHMSRTKRKCKEITLQVLKWHVGLQQRSQFDWIRLDREIPQFLT
jgi:hypothetical protein